MRVLIEVVSLADFGTAVFHSCKNKLNFVFWISSQTSVFFVHRLVFGGGIPGFVAQFGPE